MNWYKASNECRRRKATFINTNNQTELRDIHSYLVRNYMIKTFLESHIKLEMSKTSNNRQDEKVFSYKKIKISTDSRLKDRLCKTDRSGLLHFKGKSLTKL